MKIITYMFKIDILHFQRHLFGSLSSSVFFDKLKSAGDNV